MEILNTPNAVYWDTTALKAEIERLRCLLYRADAVIFDTCLCAAGCLPAKETPKQLSDWAQLSVERYLSVNPQCRPRRVTLQAMG